MNVLSLKKLEDFYHESELGCKVTFSTEDNSAVVSDPEKPAEVFVLKVHTTIRSALVCIAQPSIMPNSILDHYPTDTVWIPKRKSKDQGRFGELPKHGQLQAEL